MGELPLVGLGESELKRLMRGWRRETGSWFQKREEAYWKNVIRREDDVDGQASLVWPEMKSECCEETERSERWWGYEHKKVV